MEVTRPLLLRLFYLVKWPITPSKSAGSVTSIPETPRSFGISVNPIQTKGDRLCPQYYYWHPIFLNNAAYHQVASEDPLGIYKLLSFQEGSTKLERFLHKN